jgi:hypothetical protein
MGVSGILNIKGLEFNDPNFNILLNGVALLGRDHPFIEKTVNDASFISIIGGFLEKEMKESPAFALYQNFGTKENYLDQQAELISKFVSIPEEFIDFLWFIKDNSVSLKRLIIFDQDGEKQPSLVEYSPENSNCIGECDSVVKFTKDQISEAFDVFNKFQRIIEGYNKVKPKRFQHRLHNDELDFREGKAMGVIRQSSSAVNYNNYERLEKSWIFLKRARSSNVLINKVAFYIMALETLFSYENQELKHKIGERVSLYIETGYLERKEVYDFLAKAYTTRSNYVHGGKSQDIQNMNHSDSIKHMTSGLDEILRVVMRKVIEYDFEHFQSDQLLTEFLFKMLFSTKPTVDEDNAESQKLPS